MYISIYHFLLLTKIINGLPFKLCFCIFRIVDFFESFYLIYKHHFVFFKLGLSKFQSRAYEQSSLSSHLPYNYIF